MKITFLLLDVLLLLATPAFAQSAPTIQPTKTFPSAIAPGCGAPKIKYAVKTDKHQHPFIEPNASKALVYFIEDDSQFQASPKPTTRAGLDGKWVGATHGNSYFYFPVDPGEHHLCASWQTIGSARYEAAAHFTAEAGKSYFFRVRDTWIFPKDTGLIQKMDFSQVNSDEGQLLASQYAFATSHPKK